MAQRILLVDDSIDDRFLLERALQRILPTGSSICALNSGNKAIAYMIGEGKFSDRKRYPFPTLVVTDLDMRDGDGFDVLEFLQANPAWSVVPRIVFSSSDNENDIRTAFLLGASAYHLKDSVEHRGKGLKLRFQQLLEYWTTSQVPPVDETGRLLQTMSTGRQSARYPQPKGGKKMKRPAAADKING